MLKTGIIGFVLTAICCLTPVLVWLFTAAGLSALVGSLDFFLFAMLGLFAVLCIVGLARRGKNPPSEEEQA